MNQQTRTGLAPKSWGAVAVWLVVIAVFISRPADVLTLTFAAIRGTGEWIAYTAFADCTETPPLDWMAPKECPPPLDADQGPNGGGGGSPGTIVAVPPSLPEVDGDDVRQALDAGTGKVAELHAWVADAQHDNRFVFRYGTSDGEGDGS